MYMIPFTQRPGYRPKTILGNTTSDSPVEFDLRMASGPDQARVKSLLEATTGLTLDLARWTPEVQRNVVVALERGSELFVSTVGTIRNLSAPAQLCRIVALQVGQHAKDDDPIAIDTGVKFARVAPYMPFLALELAFEIATLTNQAQIDPRFFDSPSGSPVSAATPNGIARGARKRSNARATAASPDQTADRPRTT